jgi:hypothetical protein
MVFRPAELDPHQQSFNAADKEKNEGGDDVALADRRVVDVLKPTPETGRALPRGLEVRALYLFGRLDCRNFLDAYQVVLPTSSHANTSAMAADPWN